MKTISTLITLILLFLRLSSAATSGTFDLLTYNIAGLPAFLTDNGVPGDKATNAAAIGSKFAEYAYDVIHVQEDFAYHSDLYEHDNHAYRTVTSGNVPLGSGLNTLSRFPWTTFARVPWSTCFINEADCLTPKGFTFMRLQLPSSVTVDLYNLHADAGDEQGDKNARRANVQQLLAYIAANSVGRAVVIAGDLNDRYTESGRSIDLLTAAGFHDAWIELVRGGVAPAAGSANIDCGIPAGTNDCEDVDKILYRSGDSVSLSALTYIHVANKFVQPNGDRLSDHNPIRVEFAWSTA
ncbi:hypothetical protein G647_05366 [Cladophialophora carrionii CBS 160.54]|uniref:Inositol polyphosphate-related phosphatase domain-containing protein n=1 Tax=Cladophialophora carrionii CBS 160.54 TaxID=1279043 RepID=V9D9G6_9EURO|nr:uncharacterized protein G647_05366 [Cladophialophora carrionii CBS 160.54]ETI23564.1 hypothetical protein G647_05366 [Cladophialophora carrionii CBS 160.54]